MNMDIRHEAYDLYIDRPRGTDITVAAIIDAGMRQCFGEDYDKRLYFEVNYQGETYE